MKAIFSKTVLACAVAAASMFAGAAQAQNYLDFTVQKPGTGTSTTGRFVADKIVSNYVERITFNTDNTFKVDLFFDFEGFALNGGTASADNTGLNSTYDVYGFYSAVGTVAPNGQGGTKFTFTPGPTSSLQVWLDRNNNTTFTPQDTGLPFSFGNTGDDVRLGSGTGISGSGNLYPNSENCLEDIECGSFGAVTSFNLTSAGKAFFIAPRPFFMEAVERGQLNNFPTTPGTSTLINGSMDINFRAPGQVPEPASLGLLGLGLLGLGAARRRKQAK